MGFGFKIIVTGDYACFTRPEMKVERVSYDVPTPSALEGLIKCIYWKPAIKIVIDKIVVFNPIRFINVRRNEVTAKVAFRAVKNRMTGGTNKPDIYTEDFINQRASMLLKDVQYGIEFHFEMTGFKSDQEDDTPEKHYNMLLRRLKKGQYHRHPSLGCREFSVRSIEIVEKFPLDEISSELRGDIDLGYMLYGLKFKDRGVPINSDWKNPVFSDKADPVFYRPHLINGIIDVKKYREGIKC